MSRHEHKYSEYEMSQHENAYIYQATPNQRSIYEKVKRH